MTAGLVHQGLPVELAGVVYTMPSLNAAAAKRYWPRIQAMEANTEPDPLGLVASLVHACLLRNYPDLPEAVVSENVDMDNFEQLSSKVFGAAAFRKWCDAQAAAQGNAEAPQPQATAGTGAPSTPASPPPPGTDSPTSTP